MSMQPSPQGIASLYMGNPGALQQKVQKEQQAKPGLPPDLKNLLALNIVTNEQDAAKRQQAMNALNQMAPGGQQPPTVAQSLQEQAKQKIQAQMLQQQRQQQGLAALAEQRPSMEVPANTPQPAQQPQGIDELPVEMELAGGGIVAFDKGDSVKGIQYGGAYGGAPMTGQTGLEGKSLGELWDMFVSAIPTEEDTRRKDRAEREAREAERLRPRREMEAERARNMAAVNSEEFRRPAMANDPRLVAPIAPAETAAPAVKPPAAGIAAAAAAQPKTAARTSPQDSLSALLEQGIRADLGRDREAEAIRMSDRFAQMSGYDSAVKELQDIMGDRRKAIDEAKANRTPEWVRGLQALGGAPVRGGLGMMLGQAGAAATKARDAYGDEDMKFTQELGKLREGVVRAQLEGNAAKAKTYMDAYKEVDAARRAALTSGTSLENARETAAARKQAAADAAAARADARADKTDEVMRQKAMAMAMAAAQKQMANPMNMVKYKGMSTEEVAASMYNKIYEALKTGKMPTAPGAQSPGGTTRMRFDASGNLIQ